MGTIWKISEIILGHIWLFLAGTLKPSKGISIHSKTRILGPIKIFMLRGRQKLESFNNKQNVFKERARRVSLSFHNPLQLRKQPAFTSPLSARLFQPPNGRQGLRLATFFLPTDRGTAWARHAMHNLSSNLCNLRKTCSLRLFLRNAWRSREERIFSHCACCVPSKYTPYIHLTICCRAKVTEVGCEIRP